MIHTATPFFALLAGCRAGPTVFPPEPAELDAPTLWEATEPLVALGPRMVGTPTEEEAARVVAALFLEAGLQRVRMEAFTWDAWIPGEAWVDVAGRRFPAEPLGPSAPVSLVGPLASETDPDLHGAVALATNVGTNRGVQALLLRAAGAAAMVRITEERDRDGGSLVEVGHTFVGVDWPSVAVDAEAGAYLREHLGREASIELDSRTLSGHRSWNVVGEIPGRGDGLVVVLAHYDSWHLSSSMADNALGVGAMVTLARVLVEGQRPEPTVRFVATGAEEQGLQGALAYVEAHRAEVARARLVLNLDVMWASEGSFVVMSDEPRWWAIARDAADAEGLVAYDGGVPTPSSDQFPFQIAGAPTFWAGRFGWREYHTAADLPERIDMEEAAAALRVQWAVLASEVFPP